MTERAIKKEHMPKVNFELYSQFRKNFPLICTDGVILHNEKVLLIKRSIKPFQGYWTIPGGHIDYGESSQEALIREIKEETNIDVEIIRLIKLYDDPKRDPWGHIISIAYLCNPLNIDAEFIENEEVESICWNDINKLPENIGFDHRIMINDAIRIRGEN